MAARTGRPDRHVPQHGRGACGEPSKRATRSSAFATGLPAASTTCPLSVANASSTSVPKSWSSARLAFYLSGRPIAITGQCHLQLITIAPIQGRGLKSAIAGDLRHRHEGVQLSIAWEHGLGKRLRQLPRAGQRDPGGRQGISAAVDHSSAKPAGVAGRDHQLYRAVDSLGTTVTGP